jgi:hypothetical protein
MTEPNLDTSKPVPAVTRCPPGRASGLRRSDRGGTAPHWRTPGLGTSLPSRQKRNERNQRNRGGVTLVTEVTLFGERGGLIES